MSIKWAADITKNDLYVIPETGQARTVIKTEITEDGGYLLYSVPGDGSSRIVMTEVYTVQDVLETRP